MSGIPGAFRREKLWILIDIFAKMSPKRHLSDILRNVRKPWKSNFWVKIGTGTLLKRSAGAVLKNMEKQWKVDRKMRGFREPKSSESVEPSSISWFLDIHENNEKTMPKGTSKIMFFWSKWRQGPPRFDLSSDSWRFGATPKKHVFWMAPKSAKKSKKSSKGVRKAGTTFNVECDSAQNGPSMKKRNIDILKREEVITHASRPKGPANIYIYI